MVTMANVDSERETVTYQFSPNVKSRTWTFNSLVKAISWTDVNITINSRNQWYSLHVQWRVSVKVSTIKNFWNWRRMSYELKISNASQVEAIVRVCSRRCEDNSIKVSSQRSIQSTITFLLTLLILYTCDLFGRRAGVELFVFTFRTTATHLLSPVHGKDNGTRGTHISTGEEGIRRGTKKKEV
jgi:hypothetical protein